MAELLATSPKRHLFVDLYRSAVILLMLEGHVLREFLPASMQQSALFQFHEFFHGLTAPAFLFSSGLTFVLTTRSRWEDYHHWGKPLARRIRRLCYVMMLGLILNLPFFSIRKIIVDGSVNDFLQLFRCEVLLCISIGLLSLHLIIFLFRNERHFYQLVFATILGIALLTPFVWDFDFLTLFPPLLAQSLNGLHGSQFPMFPYVGFLYAGVIVSWELTVAIERNQERQFMSQLFAFGGAFIVAGMILDLIPVQLYPTYNFWYTSPNYFFIRLGALMIIVAAVWYIAHNFSSIGRVHTVFGKESLFVYVLHLLILYGSAMNPKSNLRQFLGSDLSLVAAISVLVGFVGALLIIAMSWNYLKERHRNIYRLVQIAGAMWFLHAMFRADY